jgi:hypothetical protein
MSKQLLKPYYLNDCNCGKQSTCVVCRSKYQRKLRDAMTPQDKADLCLVAKEQYKNQTKKQRAKLKARHAVYYQNLSPEKLEERKEYQRKRYRNKVLNKQESK